MNTLDAISGRYSYRGKYQRIEVPREHLMRILQAGMDAPSGCNKQTTSFIAVYDPEILARIYSVMDPPLGDTAPALIFVLTREIIAYRNRVFNVQDYSAAIQNMLLAIHDLGYASCWVEGYVTDETGTGIKMAEILGVPGDYRLVAYLPVGFPESVPRRVRKKPFEERGWFNGFGKTE